VAIGSRDPVASGWAASLGRPGGNITGLTVSYPGVPAKALQFLREAVPRLTRVAVFVTPAIAGNYRRDLQEGAKALDLEVSFVNVSVPADFESAFASAKSHHAQALHVTEDATLFSSRARLAQLAVMARLPSIGLLRQMTEAGFLMSYGPDVDDLTRRAADYVDKILKGARAGDLPFERPTKFELVINAKTARALGLTIPPTLLLLADQVIE
jgi:putative ABC transport system substrate-binding protein